MAEIKDLSATDASNSGAAANAGFPEGMSPADLNNAARALEGMLARWFKDGNGTLTTGGSADTYTLTPNRTVTAYADGDCYLIEMNATNTGASTINVSAVGAKSIVTPSGSALAAGELTSGGRYLISYDGTNFQLIGAVSDGAISNARIRDSAGLSVIGRAANSTGDVADITAGTDAYVLRRSGTSIAFGTVATGGIADDAVTYAKIQDVSATSRILGRVTAGSGVVEELTGTQAGTIIGAASDTASGVVELATADESRTGTSTALAMAPGYFAGHKSLGEEGYYTFPGGFTIQWGRYATSIAAQTAITFPVAFTTIYTVVAAPLMDSTTVVDVAFGVDPDTISTTGFEFYVNTTLGDGFSWIAIGLKTS